MSNPINIFKKILEFLWLTITIAAFGIGIKEHFINTYKEALPFYLFAFIALFFFTSRRKTRRSQTETKDK